MPNNYADVKSLPNELVIFDLDGCICDDEWRLPKIKPDHEEKRWDEYHDNLDHDMLLEPGRVLLHKHITWFRGVVLITARPERVRNSTIVHLQRMSPGFIGAPFILLMRQESEEGIGAVNLKRAMTRNLHSHLKSEQHVVWAYDDRGDIVSMYLGLGINASVLDKNGLRHSDRHIEMWHDIQWQTRVVINDSQPNGNGFPVNKDKPNPETSQRNAGDILLEAGKTFKERNAVYKDNAAKVGEVMAVLFPDGVQLKTAADHQMYHLFELIIVKLTRFTNSGLQHQDSVHDLAVYAAMCENLVETHNIKFGEKTE